MDYRARMKVALIASFLIHMTVLGTAAFYPQRPRPLAFGTEQEPIVIDLARANPPKQFVDTLTPSNESPDPSTDLISDKNSKAADMSDGEGTRPAPHFDTPSDYDDLGGTSSTLVQPVAPRTLPQEQSPQKPSEKETPKPNPPKEDKPAPLKAVEPVEPEETAPPEERFDMAKAEVPPELPTHEGQPKGRVDGGVKSDGFMSFEAMQDDFAPYFKEVRNRVEKRWRRALHMKYSGASKTKAVVDCAIRPDGTLAYVTIVEGGSSATYAMVCKEAIEGAGPFPPFPFSVPEIYRTKNLEIRWTFSFM